MLFYAFITLLWSINREMTSYHLFYMICGISIVYTMVYYCNTIERQSLVFKSIAITFFIEIILSLMEMGGLLRLPISPFSNYINYFNRAGILDNFSGNEQLLAYLGHIPTGFQWNPNNLGCVFIIIFPFFLCHPKKIVKLLGFLWILPLILGIGSRGMAVSFLFICFIYFFSKNIKTIMIGILSIILAFSLMPTILQSFNHSNNLSLQKIASTAEAVSIFIGYGVGNSGASASTRKRLIDNGLEALATTYGLGVGAGADKQVQINAGNTGKITSMHNFWIENLVGMGWIFFLLFSIWYLLVLYQLHKIRRAALDKTLNYFAESSLYSLLAFIPAAFSPSATIYILPMWLMYAFAVTTIYNYRRFR